MAMNSRTPTRQSTGLPALAGRTARGASLAVPASGLGADVLLLLAAAFLALSVFELATWLTSASFTTLVFSVACVPLALLFTAVICEHARGHDPFRALRNSPENREET